MANVSLDRQVFCAPAAAFPTPAIHEPSGLSPDEALLISSDDESNYDDLEDSQSDVSFPPISELCQPAKSKDLERGGVVRPGRYLLLLSSSRSFS